MRTPIGLGTKMTNQTNFTKAALFKCLKKMLFPSMAAILALGLIVFLFHDKLLELVFISLTKQDTVYAVGYNERNFDKIRKNMSMQEVVSQLGNPLDKREIQHGEQEIWYYSRAGVKYDNYFVRLIYFDKNKHVIKTVKKYYLD